MQNIHSVCCSVTCPMDKMPKNRLDLAFDQVRLFRNISVLIHLRIGFALHHYSVSCEKACTGPKLLTSICYRSSHIFRVP